MVEEDSGRERVKVDVIRDAVFKDGEDVRGRLTFQERRFCRPAAAAHDRPVDLGGEIVHPRRPSVVEGGSRSHGSSLPSSSSSPDGAAVMVLNEQPLVVPVNDPAQMAVRRAVDFTVGGRESVLAQS